MKKHTGWVILAIAVPLLAGGFIWWKFFKGPKKKVFDPPVKKQPPVKAVSASAFPLKNGTYNSELVKQLQGLLGVSPDGDFGPLTQAALLLKTGKTQIASQADFDSVINSLSDKMQAAAATNAQYNAAAKIVSDYRAHPDYKISVIKAFTADRYQADVYGNYTFIGPSTPIAAGRVFYWTGFDLVEATSSGKIHVRTNSDILGPGTNGDYLIDPATITLVKGSSVADTTSADNTNANDYIGGLI